jgi:hypothetical protein
MAVLVKTAELGAFLGPVERGPLVTLEPVGGFPAAPAGLNSPQDDDLADEDQDQGENDGRDYH